jgi:hypothetical protein
LGRKKERGRDVRCGMRETGRVPVKPSLDTVILA